ncbi:MAG: hypothetical protein ACXU82_13010 [Caulobacteraceae bacterium]
MTDRFVHRQNIERFRHLLAETQDESVRDRIQQLLDEELAKDDPPPTARREPPPESQD